MFRRHKQLARSGFTLLEILLSIFVLALISMIVWQTLSNSYSLKAKLDAYQTRTHSIRTGLARFNRDVIGMFFVKDKRFGVFLEGIDEAKKDDIYRKIGLAALKFFIIKV